MNLEQELAFNRHQTGDFIAANPITLILIPKVEARTAAGGKVSADGPARLPQTLRLIDQGSGSGSVPGPIRAADGLQRRATHMLLGMWDAVIQQGDHWTSGGKRYEVLEVLHDNGYEQRGKVICYG
jgi:hypothetical protein